MKSHFKLHEITSNRNYKFNVQTENVPRVEEV